MATYSVQPRVFVKGYGFSSFAKNMGKNIGKSWLVNVVKTFLIMLKNLQQIHLKLLQKESFKKHQNNRIELQKFQKIHNKIIQKQLQMITMRKYPKKDIY